MTIKISRTDINDYVKKHLNAPFEGEVTSISAGEINLNINKSLPGIPMKISAEILLSDLQISEHRLVGSIELVLPLMARPFKGKIQEYISSQWNVFDWKKGRLDYPLPVEVWRHCDSASLKMLKDEIVLALRI